MTKASKPAPAIPPLKAIKSSSAIAIGHADGNLYVRFKNNKLYRYPGVRGTAYEALMKAESIGKHLQAHIIAKHQGELVPEPSSTVALS